jgi:hypothetical protein
MSLDVYLYEPNPDYAEWGSKKTNSLAEAGEMKGLVPLIEEYYEERKPSERNEVYWANITHNLNRMATAAGIYEALWRPEEIGITKAGQLIEPITEGLNKMRAAPGHYRQFNASNGWGTYDQFIPWIEKYLQACKDYPDSLIGVSR